MPGVGVFLNDQLCLTAPGQHAGSRGKANGFVSPLGAEPGIGHVLVTRGTAEALDLTATHTLRFFHGSETLEIPELRVIDAQQLTRAPDANISAPVLVRLGDYRYTWANAQSAYWSYNLPALEPPAFDDSDDYYQESLDGTTVWGWNELVASLWEELKPAPSGSAPTLPAEPPFDPAGYNFLGISPWAALEIVVRDAGYRLAFDPLTGEVGILDPSADDGLADAAAGEEWRREIFGFYKRGPAAFPEEILVAFRKRQPCWGNATYCETDNGPFSSAYVRKIVASGLPGAVAGTRVALLAVGQFAEVDDSGAIQNDSELDGHADKLAAAHALQLQAAASLGSDSARYWGIARSLLVPMARVAAWELADYGPLPGSMAEGLGTQLTLQIGGEQHTKPGAPIRAEFPLAAWHTPYGQALTMDYYGQPILVKVTAGFSAGGNGQAVRQEWNGSSYADVSSAVPITIYDSLNTFEGTTGDRCWVFFNRSACRWEILQKNC